jgi:transposase
MARTGRPKAVLELTSDEREQLQRWARRRTSAQALALRSRIVLACAEGRSNTAVAEELGVSVQMVGKWRARFVEARLDGLADDPRPGRPSSITAEQVEDVVVATLESTPANATHWSRAKMAERAGLSRSSIGRIWKAFDLKPHRAETFKLSGDPLFVEKVFDVVGLYLNPPEGAVVLSVDEKSQVQALARSQPAFPMMPGMPERATHRLRPPRHHQLVRGVRHRRWHRDLLAAPPAPHDRVQEVPHQDRRHSPRAPARAPDRGQLRHPQGPGDQGLAGPTPPLHPASHPDLLQLAQPGRAPSGGNGAPVPEQMERSFRR